MHLREAISAVIHAHLLNHTFLVSKKHAIFGEKHVPSTARFETCDVRDCHESIVCGFCVRVLRHIQISCAGACASLDSRKDFRQLTELPLIQRSYKTFEGWVFCNSKRRSRCFALSLHGCLAPRSADLWSARRRHVKIHEKFTRRRSTRTGMNFTLRQRISPFCVACL